MCKKINKNERKLVAGTIFVWTRFNCRGKRSKWEQMPRKQLSISRFLTFRIDDRHVRSATIVFLGWVLLSIIIFLFIVYTVILVLVHPLRDYFTYLRGIKLWRIIVGEHSMGRYASECLVNIPIKVFLLNSVMYNKLTNWVPFRT